MKTTNKPNFLYHQYLNKLKIEKRWVRFYQLIILIVFFSLWETASRLHWVNPLIFSSPSKIWVLLVHKIQDGTIFSHIGVTVFETIMGFVLGTFLGAL